MAGWRTSRYRWPVLILGNLDGVETGIRLLIRKQPLETWHNGDPGAVFGPGAPASAVRIRQGDTFLR